MKPDEFIANQPNTDQILYYLTSAARSMLKDVDSMYGPEAKQDISYIYNWLRGDLKEGNFKEFEESYDTALRKYPDAASELYDVMYEHAGLGMDGTYEQFMAKCTDNGVSEGLNKHSFIGKIKRQHELKGKVDSTFKDIGDAQKKGDHPAASNAFRKHERYANLERPGTWSKVKEDASCGATSAGAFATGAVGAAKPKKVIRRKSAVGEGIDQVDEFKAPDAAHPFNKRTDAELKGFVKDAPEAAASIKKRGGNSAKIEKDAVTANVIKQSRQNDPRK